MFRYKKASLPKLMIISLLSLTVLGCDGSGDNNNAEIAENTDENYLDFINDRVDPLSLQEIQGVRVECH
jgi:hypothetical protein